MAPLAALICSGIMPISSKNQIERYAAAFGALFADRGIDAFLVLNCPTALAAPEEAARAVIDALAANQAALKGRNIFTRSAATCG